MVIGPADPLTSDGLTVTISGASTDEDGDAISYTYHWYQNDALRSSLGTATVPSTETAKDDEWRVVVTPSDGFDSGTAGEDTVVIGNSAPSCAGASLSPATAYAATTLTCSPSCSAYNARTKMSSCVPSQPRSMSRLPNPIMVVPGGGVTHSLANPARMAEVPFIKMLRPESACTYSYPYKFLNPLAWYGTLRDWRNITNPLSE